MAIVFDDKTIFASPILRLIDIRWDANDRRPTGEYASDFAEITFQRSGMFVKNYGRGAVTCDPNTLLFINAGEAYCLSHPISLRCASTALLIDPGVLREIVCQCGGRIPDRDERLFAFEQCPTCAEFTMAHYRLLSLAQSTNGVDPVAIEESGLRLAAQVIGAACRQRGRRARRVRPSTARAHADTAQAVREFLTAHCHERLTLGRIAAHVHSAPHHLCRVFKEQTGIPIHRYLTRLRLAAALEQLTETTRSLNEVAMELGFSNHSHFSTAFLAEFGVQPSCLRRGLRANGLRQGSRELQAPQYPAQAP